MGPDSEKKAVTVSEFSVSANKTDMDTKADTLLLTQTRVTDTYEGGRND